MRITVRRLKKLVKEANTDAVVIELTRDQARRLHTMCHEVPGEVEQGIAGEIIDLIDAAQGVDVNYGTWD
jgi:hypothetical protein